MVVFLKKMWAKTGFKILAVEGVIFDRLERKLILLNNLRMSTLLN